MKAAILCVGILLSVGACKKSTGGSGGGGAPTGWLVGTSGLMVNVGTTGKAATYNLTSSQDLTAIACQSTGDAWVVGNHGTLLFTQDAGASWATQTIPTTADLRSLATKDSGPVFVVGNGVFLTSDNLGKTWTSLGDGTANFRSVAAAQDGDTVLALADDGRLFSFENGALVQRGTFAGARVVAISPDGETVLLAGDNLITKSTDAGKTFNPLTLGASVRLNDARIDDSGEVLSVGALDGIGEVAHVSPSGVVSLQQLGGAELNTVHLSDEGDEPIGFAAGVGGQTWMTVDSGVTWRLGPNLGRTVLGVDEIGAGHR